MQALGAPGFDFWGGEAGRNLLRALAMSSPGLQGGQTLPGTIPAPRTCCPQEPGVPEPQGYGGDEGHEEQEEQHQGQDEESVLVGAAGEEGSYQRGMV